MKTKNNKPLHTDRPKSSLLSPEDRASLEGALLLNPVEFDEAVFAVARGPAGGTVAVYDHDLLVEIDLALLVLAWEQEGQTGDRPEWEDASSDVDFNMVGTAQHLAGRSPLIVIATDNLDDAEPQELIELNGKMYIRC